MIKIEWLAGNDLEYYCAVVSDRNSLFSLCWVLQHATLIAQFRVEGSFPSDYGYSNSMLSKWVKVFDYSSMRKEE